MRQLHLPLSDDYGDLAGTMPAIRAAMRRAAGSADGDGRKALPDQINAIARHHEIRLTSGNSKTVSKDTLDKWLSPSDMSHPPSILALLVFCRTTHDVRPMLTMVLALGRELATALVVEAARALGMEVMTEEDKTDAAYGRACRMEREAKRAKKRIEENML